MLLTLRKFTVIFLAILQLIAPLVHAHVGGDNSLLPNSGFGSLHVPGLEKYSIAADGSSPQAMLHCRVAMHDTGSDGLLVGIDTGIKDNQANVGLDIDNSHCLYDQAAIFSTALSFLDFSSPTLSPLFVWRLFIPSLSPRAPPTC